MNSNPYLDVLRQAENGTLPDNIDSKSVPSADLVKELISAGYLEAIDTSNLDGPGFLSPKITLRGREYLQQLEQNLKATSLSGRVGKRIPALLKWVFGIVAVVLAAYLIKVFVNS